jgi:hypothetical protein
MKCKAQWHPAYDGVIAISLLAASLKDQSGFDHLNSRPPGGDLILETQLSRSASGDEESSRQ